LVGAYRETVGSLWGRALVNIVIFLPQTAGEVLEDEGLFEEEDEEETGALAMSVASFCFNMLLTDVLLADFIVANLLISLAKITLVYENWGLRQNLESRISVSPSGYSRAKKVKTNLLRQSHISFV